MMADKLLDAIDNKQNPCVVGLDPELERLPRHLIKEDTFDAAADAIRGFNYRIIDEVSDLVPAVKLQIAFYEKYGHAGLKAFCDTVSYAKQKGLIVIEDGKRNDIGSTSQAYADGHLGKVWMPGSKVPSLDVDLLTINPFLGSDGLIPFTKTCKEYGKGVFILVKTSNPSSGELQDRLVEITNAEMADLSKLGVETDGRTELYNLAALHVNRYAQDLVGKRGYSSIGAVVGATYPGQAAILRKIMPNSIFLVPGYGAQGGSAKNLINCFNEDGCGAVVNSSRGIIFAYEKANDPDRFAEHARQATKRMITDVCSAMRECGKWPKGWR